MRLRFEHLPAALVAALALFVLGGAYRSARARQQRVESRASAECSRIGNGRKRGRPERSEGPVCAGEAGNADPSLVAQDDHVGRRQLANDPLVPAARTALTPPGEMRRRVRGLSPGSYIDDILAEQDSALYRWPERLQDALRVFIEPASPAAGWSDRYPQIARDVFAEWSEAGFPLRFTFIYDSASADIRIHWVDRFPAEEGQRIGVTERTQTSGFLIARANVSIANHDSLGRQLALATVNGILRHEIGHALGLNHSHDATSVMYRESATANISPSDRATLRLIYLVPPGSLR